MHETTAIVQAATRNGVIILGGGSPKNFYLQTQPQLWEVLGIDKGGHDYFIQITQDAPHWGGLSGATPSEAVSWGKVKPEMLGDTVVVYADTTLAFPLLAVYAVSRAAPRPRRELVYAARSDAGRSARGLRRWCGRRGASRVGAGRRGARRRAGDRPRPLRARVGEKARGGAPPSTAIRSRSKGMRHVREVLADIERWQAAGRRCALATVVSVTGSAPRGVGATLAVSETGEVSGSVSGGCVEPAVIEEGLRVLRGGAPRLLTFGITEEQNVEQIGLSCGGEIRVFVERAANLASLIEAARSGRPMVRAVVIAAPFGSAATPGAALLIADRGESAVADVPMGGLGAPELDAAAREVAAELAQRETSAAARVALARWRDSRGLLRRHSRRRRYW